ncbi:hypothetical protein F7P78_10860 [Fusobacterium naviforme]|uniref:Uncharacterized protein n=1 Tax=Moryella indoligenes TaxID=371674 RepID=A0AAE3VBW7_9FIRM|nr:hypothetical protein [Moryella indoligenes]KAB0575611.1 hypothetical protein F7P78_10860 [Fusobacterium naviforme]MDQ0153439.1 hypothetical protein [Moryella indoligenes]
MLKVSKSTCSSKSGSIFTFEKSMLSFGVKNPLLSSEAAFSPAASPSASSPLSAFADDEEAPFSAEAAEVPLRSVGTKWYIIHLLFYHLPGSTDILFEAHF